MNLQAKFDYLLRRHWETEGFSQESTKQFLQEFENAMQDQAINVVLKVRYDDNTYDD